MRSRELREIGLGLTDSLIVSTVEKMETLLITTDEKILNKADEISAPAYTLKEAVEKVISME